MKNITHTSNLLQYPLERETNPDNTANNPIGSNLICKVCGLLKSNHDCELELANPKPKKVKPTLEELLWGVSNTPPCSGLGAKLKTGALLRVKTPKKKSKPKDPRPAKFYARKVEGEDRLEIRGIKEPKFQSHFEKEWDYESLGEYELGGNGKNHTLENLKHLTGFGIDLDSKHALIPLNPETIFLRAQELGIEDLIGRIDSTPHDGFHVKLYILKMRKDKHLDYFMSRMRLLYELFKDLGSDPNSISAIQFFRTGKLGTVYESGVVTTVREIDRRLRQKGFLPSKKREDKHPRRRNQQSFDKVSLPRLRQFFKDNHEWKGTYKELSENLHIPERTVYYLIPVLCREGLKTKTVRAGKTWVTQFSFDTARKELLNMGGAGAGLYQRALSKAKSEGVSAGARNSVVFSLALWGYAVKKWDYALALSELTPVFLAIDRRSVEFSKPFSQVEFERSVRSASKKKYEELGLFKCSKFRGLIMGFVNLQCQESSAGIAQVIEMEG